MIYSAVYQESNICINGNKKTISRFSEGWVGCGPSNICKCTRNKISVSVSKTKLNQSDELKKEIESKKINTMLTKYGVKYNSQRDSVKKILSKPKIHENSFSLLNNREWLEEQYINKERSLVDLAQELDVYYGTVAEYCKKHNFKIRQRANYSLQELEICNLLNESNIEYITNDWEQLGNKEIDIFIPSKSVGIEINGLYWHSYSPLCNHSPKIENKYRHLNKKKEAKDLGIDLLHFTDYELKNKNNIVKSIIKTKLGLSSQLYARKLELKNVSTSLEKTFLEQNHMQGFIPSSECIGLFLDNELYMLMSFGKPRYSKKADIELLRLCTKLNHVIVGGANRIFSEARRMYKNKTMISYCDMSKFSGTLYEKLGFRLENSGEPGYFWTDGNIIISRHKCQKHQLKKWLTSYDIHKSESENMFSAGYRRYWDCGQQSWVITL